ncbi:CBS domain-containing protein [Thermobifida halotolerans]|uniref:CBS domain-containing protein n=1 Tax=Thermobifida halotolerans TaxID=483545 RepID=A0A399G9X6_9ACTN|nr:CBS domain-containing protein [Thermobifida halotolerans]UOE20435.1 CBS domain-containing protein [Thermobifida halotolerans]
MASTVGDLMTTHVVAAFEEAGFKKLAMSLRMNGVSAVPIMDADHRVVGVVSESDLLLRLADPDLEEEPGAQRAPVARNLMSAPAVTITADATPREAAERMRRHRIKRLPVVTEDGRLLGIVSRSDLLRVYFVGDGELRETVERDVLRREFDLTGVTVSVDNGVVTLDGEVPVRSVIPRLVHAVRRVEGVVRVHSRLSYDEDDLVPLSRVR